MLEHLLNIILGGAGALIGHLVIVFFATQE